jgi:hypothetical protein
MSQKKIAQNLLSEIKRYDWMNECNHASSIYARLEKLLSLEFLYNTNHNLILTSAAKLLFSKLLKDEPIILTSVKGDPILQDLVQTYTESDETIYALVQRQASFINSPAFSLHSVTLGHTSNLIHIMYLAPSKKLIRWAYRD